MKFSVHTITLAVVLEGCDVDEVVLMLQIVESLRFFLKLHCTMQRKTPTAADFVQDYAAKRAAQLERAKLIKEERTQQVRAGLTSQFPPQAPPTNLAHPAPSYDQSQYATAPQEYSHASHGLSNWAHQGCERRP